MQRNNDNENDKDYNIDGCPLYIGRESLSKNINPVSIHKSTNIPSMPLMLAAPELELARAKCTLQQEEYEHKTPQTHKI